MEKKGPNREKAPDPEKRVSEGMTRIGSRSGQWINPERKTTLEQTASFSLNPSRGIVVDSSAPSGDTTRDREGKSLKVPLLLLKRSGPPAIL